MSEVDVVRKKKWHATGQDKPTPVPLLYLHLSAFKFGRIQQTPYKGAHLASTCMPSVWEKILRDRHKSFNSVGLALSF